VTKKMQIDAKGIPYKKLNEEIRAALRNGEKQIELINVNGQRYIGDNLGEKAVISINGTPGNDLGFVMEGPTLIVNANGQDGIGNTMGGGKIVIKGNAGDICGYAMRGGKIFIKGNVGYRSGIHMKEYENNKPIIVIGGQAGDFLGEYMAGGIIIVLGMNMDPKDIVGNYCGTGMHGGKMFIYGDVPEYKLGKEPKKSQLNEQDMAELDAILKEYSQDIGIQMNFDMKKFIKLEPGSKRPYGKLYAY